MTQLELPFNAPRPPAPDVALDLPHDPAERGYRKFLSERETAIKRLEDQFGLVLNRRVRVTLAGFPGEFTGIMKLDQLIPPGTPRDELRLRIDDVHFEARDLESCVVIRAAPPD